MRALGLREAEMPEQTAESKPAEPSADNPIAKNLGPAIMAAATFAVTWLAAGSTDIKPTLTTLAAVVAGICALVTSLLYQRYFSVLALGGEPEVSSERMAYVKLRNNVEQGGKPAITYSRWLTKFLDAVDRFFGDAGVADRILFPRVFGLKMPAPTWTAPALDRCLLLALIYPIASIFVIWAVSGHVGPAEAALGLEPNIPGWQRGITVACIGLAAFTGGRAWSAFESHTKRRPSIKVVTLLAVAFFGWTVFFFYAPVPVVAAAVVATVAVVARGVTGSGALFVFIVSSLAVGWATVGRPIWIREMSTYVAGFVCGTPLLVVGTPFLVFYPESEEGVMTVDRDRQPIFLFLFFVGMISYYFYLARMPPSFQQLLASWEANSSLVLILGLLTLLNAPFDWASLGLTRALLRTHSTISIASPKCHSRGFAGAGSCVGSPAPLVDCPRYRRGIFPARACSGSRRRV
jgi:hypothetical protein